MKATSNIQHPASNIQIWRAWRRGCLMLLVGCWMFSLLGAEIPQDMVCVSNGFFQPLFRSLTDPTNVPVKGFLLDVEPVTNEQFQEFVRANPRWQRSNVKRIFADENYLKHWAGDLELGTCAQPHQPVTFVSWFAAKAYAQWKGKRLPTLAEWELAAAASPTQADGSQDATFQRDILKWYSTSAPEILPNIGSGQKNFWGACDMHGLVWEWVSDFNTATVTGDARGDTGLDRQLFCGAGAVGAKDTGNFPAFMRYGFRSSLKAGYTIHNLGFRCAKDL
jgi:formylglycine-generating enzyme required for sulfatase activity